MLINRVFESVKLSRSNEKLSVQQKHIVENASAGERVSRMALDVVFPFELSYRLELPLTSLLASPKLTYCEPCLSPFKALIHEPSHKNTNVPISLLNDSHIRVADVLQAVSCQSLGDHLWPPGVHSRCSQETCNDQIKFLVASC